MNLGRKFSSFLPVGLLLLSVGIIMGFFWSNGRAAHFTRGFLIGLPIVFILSSLFRPSRPDRAPLSLN